MAGLRIVPDPGDGGRDAFVRSHPLGTPFHLSGWGRAVQRAFGHRCRDLVALEEGRVRGVLPLGHVRSLLFGDRLVSTPFAVYGGPLADAPPVAERLVAHATAEAVRLRVRHLEARFPAGGPEAWSGSDLYVTFRGPLPEDPGEILAARPKETRRGIRVGLKEGFVAREGWSDFEAFYRLLARSYRDHGTPVFPRRWFRALRAELGGVVRLQSLRDGARGPVVAGVVVLRFGDDVLPYYVGAARSCYRRHVNDVLYYEVMRRAAARGARRFDFGRSKRGTGSRDYKARWGLVESPLDYRFHLVRDARPPELNPLNPRFASRIALWKKLPLAVAERVGPAIVRGLP